jgi:hypothetical protein
MLGKQSKHQAGFALLIFLVIMMGLGGIALTGVTQNALKQVEDKRFRHNERVLKEVKQALLQFAYNYPALDGVAAGTGPGRLPCADNNNDGLSNSCFSFGRLPWREGNLNLYDIRDADGERLWYAVSSNFRTANGGIEINSEISGRITIRDQSGNIIYSGLNPGDVSKYGVAAVIIAPGRVTSRDGVIQNRAAANGENPYDLVPDTDPGIIDAANYLDLFTDSDGIVTDNAALVQNSDTGGFILGPVNEQSTDIVPVDKRSADVVNDQIIIITAAEVIEMAEKATLQAYRNAVNTYRTNIQIDTPGFDAYPWLDGYTTTNLIDYDAEVGVRLGRIPSIFADYFNNATATSQAITSDLTMLVENQLVNGFKIPSEERVISSATQIVFADGDLNVTPGLTPTGILLKRYFWDEITADGWQECSPVVVKTVQDCNQAASDLGVSNSAIVPNEVPMRVVRVTYTITIGVSTPFTRSYLGNAGSPVEYRAPTASEHAIAFFEFTDSVSISATISVGFEYDDNYDTVFTATSSGNFNYKLGVRYYPVLPTWALASEDNWHDSVQMAFSSGFQPGVITPGCTAPGTPGTDCLTVNNVGGVQNNKRAVLVLASDHDLVDDPPADGIQNDLDDIFDTEHTQAHGVGGQDVFDARSGNDQILIIR